MARKIDDESADRLLAGQVPAEDAPPGYAGVARFLGAAAAPGPMPGHADELVAAMAAQISTSHSSTTAAPTTPRRKSMIAKHVTAKVAAITLGAVVLSGGVAAAATGTLPDAAQHKIATVASHVGLSLPDSASSTAKAVHKAIADTPPGPGRGKAVSDAAHAANEARKAAKGDHSTGNDSTTTGNDTSDSAKAKADANKAAAQQHAADGKAHATTPDTETADDGDATEPGQSGADHGQSGADHGQSTDHPTTTTTAQP
jgi:hypothetical protein